MSTGSRDTGQGADRTNRGDERTDGSRGQGPARGRGRRARNRGRSRRGRAPDAAGGEATTSGTGTGNGRSAGTSSSGGNRGPQGGGRRRGPQNNRRGRNRSQKQRQEEADFWGDPSALPEPKTDVRITDDPDAVARSLGTPPLPGQEAIAGHYFAAVYDRAVATAGVLAAAGGLIDPVSLTASDDDAR